MCIYTYTRGDPENPEFIYKNCVFILTSLNFSHLQSTLHWMRYTCRDVFFHCPKQFLNSLILMPFSASAVFCLTSSTSAKCFPLRTFLSRETKKKCRSGQDRVNREGGVLPQPLNGNGSHNHVSLSLPPAPPHYHSSLSKANKHINKNC